MRRAITILSIALLAVVQCTIARAAVPPPFAHLRRELGRLVVKFPAASAVDVLDLSSGLSIGYNADASMPAASTIKVPVMVEVFHQLQSGRFTLARHVTLLASDKDWGSGELCDAPVGSTHAVSDLLTKMIDISDNTATNMLIRLVGLANINHSMTRLGLRHTRLLGDVRTAGWSIRQTLRSSPADMVNLLSHMARRQLIDAWSSNEMLSILEEDQFNSLLPAALPDDITVAHKTGSLFDTLNDVGIVYANESPYVIAVMTTGLPSLELGRTFIHSFSRLAFHDELRLAHWRSMMHFNTFDTGTLGVTSPDVRYWEGPARTAVGGGE